MVFIDYQNTHLGARERFLPVGTPVSAGHVNPRHLADLLVARRRWSGVRQRRRFPALGCLPKTTHGLKARVSLSGLTTS